MINQSLELATKILLQPAELTDVKLNKIFMSMLAYNIDNADLYFQSIEHESWVLEDGIIKNAGSSINKGVGVRAIVGDKTGFAYTDGIAIDSLEQSATMARSIALKGGTSQKIATRKNIQIKNDLYNQLNPIGKLSVQDKINLLYALDKEARKQDPCVTQVICSLSGSYEIVLIIATDGTYAADIRPLVRLNVSVVVEKNQKHEAAIYGGGGRDSYQMFFENNWGLSFARNAVRQALVNLEAKPTPAGMMPVVLGSGWAGVLLHEAVGHGLEADSNRKKSSAFAGRIGEQVASTSCTVVDNGTIAGKRGSLNIDDEGTPTQCTTLIEKGVLRGYMQDKLNAKLMADKPTGNGRRESYACLPIPRMTNTYMLAGNYDSQEIIQSVKKGIYAVNFKGGQVDITSGKFVFNVSEAYLIENGKITSPIKGASLIGNGPEILKQVSMVGNDLQLDEGIGTCGKHGQNVPVGVGQPTVLIDQITVGGTE
jgi:TldD protein